MYRAYNYGRATVHNEGPTGTVAEFVASDKGLGYLLLQYNGNLDTPMVFAVIFLLSFIVLVCMHRLVRPRAAAVVGRAFSSYTAELVALRARGALFPKGRAEMYRAFLRDVQRDAKRNGAIPPRPRLSPRNPRLAARETEASAPM